MKEGRRGQHTLDHRRGGEHLRTRHVRIHNALPPQRSNRPVSPSGKSPSPTQAPVAVPRSRCCKASPVEGSESAPPETRAGV